jgi:periplasmic protein TonB
MQWKLNYIMEDKMKTNISTAVYALKFEEIIFANKNKNYGAFVLRKNYRRNLFLSCGAAIIIMLISVLLQKAEKKMTINSIVKDPITIDLLNTPPIDKPVTIPENTTPVFKQTTVKFTVPKVVEDEQAQEYFPTIDDLGDALPWTDTQAGSENGIDINTLVPVAPPVEVETVVPDQPVLFAEEMPAYAEGTEALLNFISSKIKYPELARKAGIEGKVYIYFIVNRDGTISNAEIARGIGAGCDEEALRVIRQLGKWIPGKQNGKAVRVKMAIPIVFKLN